MPVGVPAPVILIQVTANAPEKAAKNDPSTLASANHIGVSDGLLSAWLRLHLAPATVVTLSVTQQMEDLFFFLSNK